MKMMYCEGKDKNRVTMDRNNDDMDHNLDVPVFTVNLYEQPKEERAYSRAKGESCQVKGKEIEGERRREETRGNKERKQGRQSSSEVDELLRYFVS